MKKIFTMLAAAAMLCVAGCEETPSNEPNNGGGGDVEKPEPPAETNVIEFEDGTVMRICVDNWDTDKDGKLSHGEARAIKSLGGKFKNTNVTSFNEFQYFTGIESIGNDEFRRCSNLKSIIIPNSVKTIGEYAFCVCESLTSITIPGSVKTIGNDAFSDCASLTDVTLSDGVETIGEYAFGHCESLTSITIPSNVKTIEVGAFGECKNLVNVTTNKVCILYINIITFSISYQRNNIGTKPIF